MSDAKQHLVQCLFYAQIPGRIQERVMHAPCKGRIRLRGSALVPSIVGSFADEGTSAPANPARRDAALAEMLTGRERGTTSRSVNHILQKNTCIINLQYFQEVITRIDDDTERLIEENNISRMGAAPTMSKTLSMRIAKVFGDAPNTLELAGIYDIKNGGYILKPQLTISPFDGVDCFLGINFFGGDDTSIFGKFAGNSEAYVRLKHSF